MPQVTRPRQRHATLCALMLSMLSLPSVTSAETRGLLEDLVNSAGFAVRDIARLAEDPLARELTVQSEATGIAFAAIIRLRTNGSRLADGSIAPKPLPGGPC